MKAFIGLISLCLSIAAIHISYVYIEQGYGRYATLTTGFWVIMFIWVVTLRIWEKLEKKQKE